MQNLRTKLLALIVLISTSAVLKAEVIRSSESYFELKFVINVKASTEQLNQSILNIASWWSPSHTYSGDSKNLTLDTQLKQCFCESLTDNGFVRHLEIGYYQPNKKLRLLGGLGPLQSLPVNGVFDFVISQQSEQASQLVVTYMVSGSGTDLSGFAIPVEQVINEQITRLKRQVEK